MSYDSENSAPVSPEATQAPLSPGVEGTAPPSEAPLVEAPKAPSQEDLDFARRFTSLTRKEREVLAREERLRGEMQSVSEWRKSQDLIKQNPLKFLETQGWDFNKLADFALNDQKPTVNHEMQELRDQLKALMSEREAEKQSSTKAAEQANIENYKSHLKSDLQSRGDKYELVNHYEEYDMVYDIMNEHYMATSRDGQPGETLDIDVVADHVEKYLEGQLEKAAKTKKFQSRYATPPVKQETKTGSYAESNEVGDRSPRTLTNANFSGSRESDTTGYLDEDASKARSAKILEDMWRRNSQK